jgi:hypothetical protein
MKTILSLLLFCSSALLVAQTNRQEIPINGATAVHLNADISGLIITTGGTNSIVINHVLEVDGKDRSDLKALDIDYSGDQLKITERGPTNNQLAKEFGKGNMMVTHNKSQHNGQWDGEDQTHVRAYIEVVVPKGVKITAETLYGGIEAVGVTNMPFAKSTYGTVEIVFAEEAKITGLDYASTYQSVDVALPADIAANINLKTDYGSMYSDFDYKVPAQSIKKHLRGTINGGGIPIKITATYQNIYLRKL